MTRSRNHSSSSVLALAASALFLTPFFISVSAHAAQVCSNEVHHKFDDVRIYSKAFIASCKPGSHCRLVTHRLDKKAPLGFSHTLTFQRDTPQAPWRVLLVDVFELAETSQGFTLTVDKNSSLDIPAGLITAPLSVNEYALDPSLTPQVMEQAKPGDRIVWTYPAQTQQVKKVQFSLAGLSKALEWAECAQAKLASGKTDPAPTDNKQPEYSPPEPDVPVDPVGD